MPMTKLTLPAADLPRVELPTPAGMLVVPGMSLGAREFEIDADLVASLTRSARDAAKSAYAPFSRFAVGAALVMADDPGSQLITGCNVENSSYGGTVCAERNAIQAAAARGFRRLRLLAVSTLATLDAPLRDRSPCGLCRQVIREFADAETLVICDRGEPGVLGDLFDIDRLLPYGFRFAPPEGTES